MPEEGETLLATVSNIYHHSVFVDLDEYGGRTGLIHISEISPGRIRNLRDFVKEGKKLVVVVLRIHKDKGHIDLSLRRVNDSQRRRKLNEIKQEQMSEKILEQIAKKHKKDVKALYDQIFKAMNKDYEELRFLFQDVATGEAKLEDYGVDKKLATEMKEIIEVRFKPQEIEIKGDMKISTFANNGVEIIKAALLKADKKNNVTILYKGAGIYNLSITSLDYKDAEKDLEDSLEIIKEGVGGDGTLEFTRKEAA